MERNIEALKQLRRVAEEAPDDLLHMRAVVEVAECGTARCLLGWAIVDPWFREHSPLKEVDANYEWKGFPGGSVSDMRWFLNISARDARYLFADGIDPSSDPHGITKKEVLDNIDRLIAGEDAERYDAVYT